MNTCDCCQHVEMCGWRESFEGRGCDFFDDGNRWIPVSERLPEEQEWLGTEIFGTTISDEVCITFDNNGKRFVKVMSLQNGELSDSDKRMMDVFHKGWKMLAWMPLPEPYRKGQNNEAD